MGSRGAEIPAVWATNVYWKMRWEHLAGWGWGLSCAEWGTEGLQCGAHYACLSIRLFIYIFQNYAVRVHYQIVPRSCRWFWICMIQLHNIAKSHIHLIEILFQILNFIFFPNFQHVILTLWSWDSGSQSLFSTSCAITMCRHSMGAMLLNLDVW